MERILHSIILSTAFLAAFVLFCLGVRELRIGRKPGLFMMALLIAFSLIGVSCSGQSADSPSKPAKPYAEKYPESRVLDLNKTQEWKNFKAFWKKLNQVSPKKKNNKDSGYFGEYYGAIAPDVAHKWIEELKGLISGLNQIKLDPVDTVLFEKICTERIYQMSSGSQSLMTRMIAPSSVLEKERTIRDMELRIDILIELRKKEKISESEMNQALSNIKQDIKTFSAYEAFSKHFASYWAPVYPNGNQKSGEETDIIDRLSADNEKSYSDFKARKRQQGMTQEAEALFNKDMDSQYKETKETLLNLKKELPFINEMISDLEQ
jgi:hypothetical protein